MPFAPLLRLPQCEVRPHISMRDNRFGLPRVPMVRCTSRDGAATGLQEAFPCEPDEW